MPWKLKINGTFFIALIFLLVALFLIFALNSRNEDYSKVFMPFKGKLALTESDFRYNILLSGEWEFYDGQLLEDAGGDAEGGEYVMVPHIWNRTGYGSYRLIIEGLNPETCYSLYVPDMGGAYRLLINGEERGLSGTVGTERSAESLHWEPLIITFRTEGGSVELILQLSNFHSTPGGFLREMKLGLSEAIHKEEGRNLGSEMIVLGGLLIVALYNLCLFLLNTENRSALLFSLFNLIVSLRLIITGEKIINFWLTDLNWYPLIRLQYAAGFLMLGFFVLFMNTLFRSELRRWIVRFFLGFTALLLLLGLFLPIQDLAFTDTLFLVGSLLFFVYLLFILIRAVRAGIPGALYAFIGIAFVVGTIILDTTLPPGTKIIPVGIFIFTIFQSLVIAERHSRMAEQNRALHLVAVRDEMTGLFKKQHFRKLVEEALDAAGKESQHAMMFIDMDNFKGVNDSYGHETGDELIITVARILQGALRSSDMACRYGGDEFMIWLEGAGQDQAEIAARRILKRISDPVSIREYEFHQSVSIGISFHSDDAQDFDGLVDVCDRQMYEAKKAGKNQFKSRD